MTDEEKIYLGGAALLAVFALSAIGGNSRARAGRIQATPSAYARDKLGLLQGRLQGALGEALREFVPIAMPGGSVAAILGFTSIGGADEDTAPTHNPVFHEVGEFQTEAGPANGPAPNPNPTAAYNRWGLLGAAEVPATVSDDVVEARALVRRLLGRAPSMASGGWRGRDAVRDRAAVGVVNFWLYARQFARNSPALLPLDGEWNLWRTACAFASFSAGLGGAAAAVNRFPDVRRAVETRRFLVWCLSVAQAVERGEQFSPAGAHGNSAYTCLRTWQKLAAGRLLAERNGLDVNWFAEMPSGNVQETTERLVRAGAQGMTA